LTVDTFRRIPEQTNQAGLTEQVARGKQLWDENNCMGCHTLLGEGAYYAPELTRVYARRGPDFIRAMLRDPEAMYPGQRRMVKDDFTPEQMNDLVAFFEWIGTMDLNGFPPGPNLMPVAVPAGAAVASVGDRPQIFNQLCVACHALGGQGGAVGPPLDGVGSRRDAASIASWLRDPIAAKPDSKMPKLPLTEGQIDELVAFLSQQKEK
jgi:nitric oxide reductase subunit C